MQTSSENDKFPSTLIFESCCVYLAITKKWPWAKDSKKGTKERRGYILSLIIARRTSLYSSINFNTGKILISPFAFSYILHLFLLNWWTGPFELMLYVIYFFLTVLRVRHQKAKKMNMILITEQNSNWFYQIFLDTCFSLRIFSCSWLSRYYILVLRIFFQQTKAHRCQVDVS